MAQEYEKCLTNLNNIYRGLILIKRSGNNDEINERQTIFDIYEKKFNSIKNKLNEIIKFAPDVHPVSSINGICNLCYKY